MRRTQREELDARRELGRLIAAVGDQIEQRGLLRRRRADRKSSAPRCRASRRRASAKPFV